MKPVPPEIEAVGPEGTAWYGGPVDLLKMSLRVHATGDERIEVSKLLNCDPDSGRKYWCLTVPTATDGDLDAMITSLLSRLTSDLVAWQSVTSRWKVDIFCGVFLERKNRGLELGAESMRLLSERNMVLEFDIYAPDDAQA